MVLILPDEQPLGQLTILHVYGPILELETDCLPFPPFLTQEFIRQEISIQSEVATHMGCHGYISETGDMDGTLDADLSITRLLLETKERCRQVCGR